MKYQGEKIIIAGGSGLIGEACKAYFNAHGATVQILTRGKGNKSGEVHWDPAKGEIAENVLEGSYAVINLCGRPLPGKRWTEQYKKELRESRIVPAQFLAKLAGACIRPPQYYIGASAVGYYGDAGQTPVVETSPPAGDTFITQLVRDWETAHESVPVEKNIRLRFGVVMSKEGGFLEQVLPPSRFGIYATFGDGSQMQSWILLDDLVRMIGEIAAGRADGGVYNATAPHAVSQKEMMKALREVSGRPGLLIPVPKWFMRILFGEMVSILFDSADAPPDKISAKGFAFSASDIRTAFRKLLKST